jgi:hypothetical protein
LPDPCQIEATLLDDDTTHFFQKFLFIGDAYYCRLTC